MVAWDWGMRTREGQGEGIKTEGIWMMNMFTILMVSQMLKLIKLYA